MGGGRLPDPLERHLRDRSDIEQVSVEDVGPAAFAELDRLGRTTDRM